MNAANLMQPNVSQALPLAVSDAEAARLLSISPRTLFNWRTDSYGPRWIKAGGRVLYAVDELRRWLTDAAEPSAAVHPPAVQAKTGQQPAVQAIQSAGGAS